MITLLFFGQTRELISTNSMTLEIETILVSELLKLLAQKDPKWQFALLENPILCAVNHEFVDLNHRISAGDEVAFFPPVTGG